jgi:hypothetical protein
MSRPGFVFDLTTEPADRSVSYRCRSCGGTAAGGEISNPALLQWWMKAHLADRHHLDGSDEWKVTVQARNGSEAVACFWPPEAF